MEDFELAELLPDFERHLRAKGRSDNTIKSYRNVANSLIKYLESQGQPTAVRSVTSARIEEYLVHRRELGRTPADRAKHYRSLQQFFKWMAREDEIASDPMDRMSPPEVPDKPVPVLPDDALGKLVKACEGKSFENRRDTALLRLFIDSGARLSEIADRNLDDVDFDQEVVHVVGKGSRPRSCPFGPKTGEALRRYIRQRSRHKHAKSPALWLGKKGALTTSGVAQILYRRAADVGVKLHPHMFRHGFADAWLSAGGQEGDLMRLMGWKSRQMLQRYAASTADKRAREAHRRFNLGDRI